VRRTDARGVRETRGAAKAGEMLRVLMLASWGRSAGRGGRGNV
jgi:hypothetical protein